MKKFVLAIGFLAMAFSLGFPFLVPARVLASVKPESNGLSSAASNAVLTYALTSSTYMGGGAEDSARGVVVDGQGYAYVVGGTSSPTFPVTKGPTFAANSSTCGSLGSAGKMDAYIMKIAPTGQMVWSRLIDSPCYSRAYAVQLDSQGNIYVAGRAGDHFPTTAGSVQPVFNGSKTNPSSKYGAQSGFVVKLTPDGSQILWATYFGGSDQSFIRDMAVDSSGQVYLAVGDVSAPNPFITSNAFQKTLGGGTDLVAAKLSTNGNQVLWATYFGGSGNDGVGPSVKVDAYGDPYYFASTTSSNLPTTTNAYQRAFGGVMDGYLVKFKPDGSGLLFSTYFGGSGEESTETHHLALDSQGNAFADFYVNSTNMPVSANAFQKVLGGGYDIGIVKFSGTGQFLGSTYYGGSGAESPQGIDTDSLGNVVIFGSSASTNLPLTTGAVQNHNNGSDDAIVARLSSDLSQLLYSTELGGSGCDQARAGAVDAQGNIVAVGWTNSANLPLLNAIQTTLGGNYDAILYRLAPTGSTNPTPTNTPPSSPTIVRTNTPTLVPTSTPTRVSTSTPIPTNAPTRTPTSLPSPTNAPTATPTAAPTNNTADDESPSIQYGPWLGAQDANTSGSSFHSVDAASNSATFSFTGSSVTWVSMKGPNLGQAQVLIDGVSKGTFDMYSATAQYKVAQTFSGLTSGSHTIQIRALGAKNPASSDFNVVVDSFVVGTSTSEDNTIGVRYNTWSGYSSGSARGGTYRSNAYAGASARFTFTGSSVTWITAKGPNYGQVSVSIDGVAVGGTIDLYSATPQWQVPFTFSGLSTGQHTLQISTLSTKNAASTGNTVVIDAFAGNMTPVVNVPFSTGPRQ